MSKFNIHRRHFLRGASATLALATLEASGMSFFASAPSPRRVALIGTGWYGKSDLFRLMQIAPVDVVSLCDVDKKLLEGAADMVAGKQKNKRPRTYTDYRKLLEETKPEIVLIGTPDHWHALQTIDALKAGAHVYV